MLSLREICRYEVFSARGKSIGRVSDVLFAPGRTEVAGFVVARPRLLFLFDRRDRFLALDRVSAGGKRLVAAGSRDAWDGPAAKRLGISWEASVIWVGMPARSESGARLGVVRDGLFDPETGRLSAIGLTEGAATDAAVGVRDLPASLVRGFDGEAVVLSDEAVAVETTGGAAAAAGRGAAVAKQAAGEAAKTAAAVGRAAVKAASKSEAGKKAMGWLKTLKDEVTDAMRDDDDK